MPTPINLSTANISTVIRKSDGALMVMTTDGLVEASQAGVTFTGGGEGGGGGGVVTIPEGGDATVGSKADAPAASATDSATLMAVTKLGASSVGPANGGAAATKATLVGAQFRTTPPALTDGQQASLQVDNGSNLKTTLATLLAGEEQDRGWQNVVNGASTVYPVPSGSVDLLIGTIGDVGDYIDHLDVYMTDSSKSQVVIRDGVTAPVLSIATHATTASTTTVINTVINAAAVAADQYKGALMKVGTEYRRILPHPAFVAGVVNQYTLDRPLSVAPAASVTVAIEDRRYVWEELPSGTYATPLQWTCQHRSSQGGYRISTESGVRLRVVGDAT
jgi:hypothetical protein